MIIVEAFYAAFCIWFAMYNAHRIIHDQRIYHGLNGALHIVAAVATAFTFHWWDGITMLFVARIFFDTALNYFRFGRINYVPLNPKSWVDKVEKKLFKNKEVAILVEVFVLVILNAL